MLPAPDGLTGHFQLSPLAGVAVPFGIARGGAAAERRHELGLGLRPGRFLRRQPYASPSAPSASSSVLGKPDSCGDCKTQSMAFGAFVRYHLVQGVRFDPWMLAGLGYRTTTISGVGDDVTYSGIEWLRLAVGGDWYAFDKVGFGPYMELDMGYYSSRSSGDMGSARAHWHLSTAGCASRSTFPASSPPPRADGPVPRPSPSAARGRARPSRRRPPLSWRPDLRRRRRLAEARPVSRRRYRAPCGAASSSRSR